VHIRVAIIGLGRITSQFVPAVHRGGFADLFEIAAIHDSAGPTGIHLALQRDSTYGRFFGEVRLRDDGLFTDETGFDVSEIVDPRFLNWEKSGVDLVILDGNAAMNRATCDLHIQNGARKVVLGDSVLDTDVAIAVGTNEAKYDPDKHHIIGLAGGITAAASIIVQILDSTYKIRCGSVTGILPVSRTSAIVDEPGQPQKNYRSAFNNLVPLSFSGPESLDMVLGKVGNRLELYCVQTPVSPVGLVRLSTWLDQKTSLNDLLDVLRRAAEDSALAGILGIEQQELTAADYRGDSRSVIVDESSVGIRYESFVGLTGWFDSEWAAACRLADLVAIICEAGVPGTA
jgi:glyceraldehyde 3-phosphate dehydrogenase